MRGAGIWIDRKLSNLWCAFLVWTLEVRRTFCGEFAFLCVYFAWASC